MPNYAWTYERMRSATAHIDRIDGRDTRELALALALQALEGRIGADNPITTIEHGLHHFEFRAYPTVALREALLNALCHLDLRLASPVLVQALSRLRLVNRSNLGIGRMFEAMLLEGKAGKVLDVDHLLVLRYLLSHAGIDTAKAAELCQRRIAEMRDILDDMAHVYGYLERGGAGRGTWWRMKPVLHRKLDGAGHAERDPRIDLDVARTRVLNMLKRRQSQGLPGLANAEVREVTGHTRLQVNRLIHALEAESVRMVGHRRGARYEYVGAASLRGAQGGE